MNFRKFLSITLALLIGLANFPVPAHAATALTETTLSVAVTVGANQIQVASATSFVVGKYVWVDNEAMEILSIAGTVIGVARGKVATKAAGHVSGKSVLLVPEGAFYSNDVSGSCTAADDDYTPHINTRNGNVFECLGFTAAVKRWAQVGGPGVSNASSMLVTGNIYTTDADAVIIEPGLHFINGSTIDVTLTSPGKYQNGMQMCILATNASAHTITYTTVGFNGNTTNTDVGTFGGAIGDNICVVAYEGVWWIVSTRNVTIG